LGPVCSVILITGAGGMFGGVLRASGIGNALADVLGSLGIPLILAGFLISAILRIAQGSATVALTTTAGLIAPAVATAGLTGMQVAALVIAVAAGSVVVSHVNDSGFWLVGRFFGMDVKTTLKTWTVMETLIGVMGFAIAAVIFLLAGVAG
jgi:GntP family gluconate:H+ symporter